MKYIRAYFALLTSVCIIVGPAGLEGCSSKASAPATTAQQDPSAAPQTSSAPATAANSQAGAPADQQQVAQSDQMQLPDVNLTPQGLDELLAPIALYPDPVLAVMLQASVDPQQVMDGGNWRVQDQNQNLKEAALDEATKKAGFTPVMQALLHYPTVVDMMCQQFDWTKQLGAAYEGNPKAVLDSVQRLRATAVDSGALKSSPQMTVDIKQDQGQQVVQLEPTNPKVVYVPQYDPQQVYSSTTTTYANGTTTTTTTSNQPISTNTTVVQQAAPQQQASSSGVSTGDAVLIGLLSFGAGIALGAAINNNNYYYPRWGYGGVYYGGRPYYPPPYHPYYGGGWGPSYGYNRPVHYGNTNIYVNNNNYYNRFNGNNNLHPGYKPMPVHYSNKPNGVYHNSMGNRPGNNTGASYNRPNNGSRPSTQPARPGYAGNNPSTRPANPGQQNPGQRPAQGNGSNWKGQNTYQGNKAGNTAGNTRPGGNNGANNGAIGTRPGGNTTPGTRPGGNPSAARPGGNTNPGTRPGGTPSPSTRPAGGNNNYAGNKGGDRGYGQPSARPGTGNASARPSQPQSRPTTQPTTKPSGAFGGNSSGSADRAASSRGRSSMGAQPQKHSGGAQKSAPKKR